MKLDLAKPCLFAALVAAGGASAWAQTTGVQLPPVTSPSSEATLFDAARATSKAAGVAASEAALFASNRNVAGTGAWYLESGQRLAWLAASFRSRKDPAAARQAAARAVEYLTTADTKLVAERKLSAAARAQEAMGKLYEEVLFDDRQAAAAYTLAIARDATAPNAIAALAKRQRSEDSLGKKLQPGSGK